MRLFFPLKEMAITLSPCNHERREIKEINENKIKLIKLTATSESHVIGPSAPCHRRHCSAPLLTHEVILVSPADVMPSSNRVVRMKGTNKIIATGTETFKRKSWVVCGSRVHRFKFFALVDREIVQFFCVFPPICAIIWTTLTHKNCFFFNGHLLPAHLVTGAGHVSADLTENSIHSFQNVTAVSPNDWLSFDTKRRASRESRHTIFFPNEKCYVRPQSPSLLAG